MAEEDRVPCFDTFMNIMPVVRAVAVDQGWGLQSKGVSSGFCKEARQHEHRLDIVCLGAATATTSCARCPSQPSDP